MRAFALFLLFANLLAYAWGQGFFTSVAGSEMRLGAPLRADEIRIISRHALPEPTPLAVRPNPRVNGEENRSVSACFLLSDLPSAEADRLERAVAEKNASFKLTRTDQVSRASYWVYIPSLPTRKDAEAKVAELKRLNVEEYFIVQDSGPYQRAISLGLFSSRDGAAKRLESLLGKGVKSARMQERSDKPPSAQLEIRGPEGEAEALRQTIAEILPERKPGPCKTQAAG